MLYPATFVGLKNYVQVFNDANFWFSILNMTKFFLIQGSIMIGLALIFALYIDNEKNHFRGLFRMIYYIPFAIPTAISGILWGFMYSKSLSPFQSIFGLVGLHPNFLSSGSLFWSIINIVTWEWAGYNMIILYSGLQSIPRELYEAAHIDGAKSFDIIKYVKIPLIVPSLILSIVFTVIGTFQIFNEPYVLGSMTFIPPSFTPNLYIYTTAFSYGNFNYAAALAIILALVTFAGSMVFMRFAGFKEE
ncbi:MAG: sugar ABC transporter permease, partial [Thermotogae bacterium]|nr:sugar ABC transporter permease [Thermotogota bacterium]